jgi:plastocyanin
VAKQTIVIWISINESKGATEMNNLRSLSVGLVLAVTLAVPMAVSSDQNDGAPADVIVQFGQNQFPQSPAPANHFLDPNDVTINKGGTVTFEINGGGHGIAIYPVSSKTDREDIEEDLCQPNPAVCNPQLTTTSNLQYLVTDDKDDLIIDTGTNPPSNRVNDPTDRLLYAGGPVFFTGRAATGAAAPEVQYRFEKTGRYLVICINRNHFINERMFGFVNVVGGDLD